MTTNNQFPVSFEDATKPTSDFAKELAAKATKEPIAGVKAVAEGRSDLYQMNPANIKVKNGFNSRDFSDPENQEHVDGIAKDIAKNGFDPAKPLTVFVEEGTVYVSDGECRLRAIHLANNKYGASVIRVPVIVEARGTNEVDRLILTRKRNSGKGFTPFEDGRLFIKLLKFGKTVEELASDFNVNFQTINNRIDLVGLPQQVKQMIQSGEVSATLALNTYRQNKENTEKTVAALTSGLESAKNAGKTKLTAKHLDANGASAPKSEAAKVQVKKSLAKLFENAKVDNSGTKEVTVKFTVEQFDEIRKLLGI